MKMIGRDWWKLGGLERKGVGGLKEWKWIVGRLGRNLEEEIEGLGFWEG
jgi:hypothetical protein